MEITFEVAGDVQLKRSFSRFGDKAQDLAEPFKAIAKDFWQIEKKQFESEGGYASGGWQPLSPRYAEWKEKNYPGRPIMVRIGYLKDSLLGLNDYSIEEITPKTLVVGTKMGIAIFHQKGAKKMPARALIHLTEKDKRRWVRILGAFLVTEAKKEFAGVARVEGEGISVIRNMNEEL